MDLLVITEEAFGHESSGSLLLSSSHQCTGKHFYRVVAGIKLNAVEPESQTVTKAAHSKIILK